MNNDQSTARERRREPGPERPRNRHWGLRWAALGLGSIVLGVVMAKTQEPAEPAPEQLVSATAAAEMQRVTLALPGRPEPSTARGAAESAPGDGLQWQELTVAPGDTLARLLQRSGIPYPVIHALANAGKAGAELARLHPGDRLRLGFDPAGESLQRLVFQRSVDRRLEFERQDGEDRFAGEIVEADLERRLHHAHGAIETSLFEAAAGADLPGRLIMELTDIFRWDIDFVYNIRKGDRFTLIYEAFYQQGERVSTGDIIAAEFINQDRIHRAVRYEDPEGEVDYFAPDGTSMRKTFLRTPVEFTRISSRYGSRRHPVSNRIRNHHGVDYAAPRGTPIQATGDGRITYRGRNGGYGKFITIEHAGRYSTAYAHMSGFASGLRVGSRVRQGQVIGYVGSTGFSTGPHLHYEFRVGGRHRNPLSIEFPSVAPVAEAHREHFEQQTAPRLAQLGTLHRAYAAVD